MFGFKPGEKVGTTYLEEDGILSPARTYGVPKMVLRNKKVGGGAGRGAFGFKPGENRIVKYRVNEEKENGVVKYRVSEEKVVADVHLERKCTERDNDPERKDKDSGKPETGTQTGLLGTGSLGT